MHGQRTRQSLVIIAALLIPILPFVIIGELPGEKWLSAADDDALLFGLTGSGLLLADILLPVPSSIVGTLLGARLGFLAGFLSVWIGLMGGNVLGYSLARLAMTRLRAWFPVFPTRTTLALVFLSRPVPVIAEAMSLTAGATRMAVLPYLAACAAGNALYALVLAANGATFIPQAWVGPGLVVPMLLPVAAWLIWRKLVGQNRSSEREQQP
ncbi:MAG: VTT domain-containing protein [Gammaproteobacteria bacterium]|nr:VTT domain-containing protein [Gammaproteobacteria bacterium]